MYALRGVSAYRHLRKWFFVIPEGAGPCQHVTEQRFCRLSASAETASGKDRGQDGVPAAQRGRTVLTPGRPGACCRRGRMRRNGTIVWLWAFSKP